GSTCTLTGPTLTTVHITGAGTCGLKASQAGNANYNAATDVTQSFTIGKQPQTITFLPLPNTVYGMPDFEVAATDTSHLGITFTAAGQCTLSPGSSAYSTLVHLTGAGTCTITASQPGDANWQAAQPVTQSFSIAPFSPGSADGNGVKASNGG